MFLFQMNSGGCVCLQTLPATAAETLFCSTKSTKTIVAFALTRVRRSKAPAASLLHRMRAAAPEKPTLFRKGARPCTFSASCTNESPTDTNPDLTETEAQANLFVRRTAKSKQCAGSELLHEIFADCSVARHKEEFLFDSLSAAIARNRVFVIPNKLTRPANSGSFQFKRQLQVPIRRLACDPAHPARS